MLCRVACAAVASSIGSDPHRQGRGLLSTSASWFALGRGGDSLSYAREVGKTYTITHKRITEPYAREVGKTHTITHKRITEPNFTIFELFSVIPVL